MLKRIFLFSLLACSLNAQLIINGGGSGGSGSSTNIPYQNVLFVSTAGDDSSATRNNLAHPFLTCGYANAVAQAGDLVEVLPGTYNGLTNINLGKNLVDWHFNNAKIICNATNAARDCIFGEGSGGACSYNVTGNGVLCMTNLAGSTTIYGIVQTNTASDIRVDLTELWIKATGAAVTGAYCGGGTQHVSFKKAYCPNVIFETDLISTATQYARGTICFPATVCFENNFGVQYCYSDNASTAANGCVTDGGTAGNYQYIDIKSMWLGSAGEGVIGGHSYTVGKVGTIFQAGAGGSCFGIDCTGSTGPTILTVDLIDLSGGATGCRGVTCLDAGTNYLTIGRCYASQPIVLTGGRCIFNGGEFISTQPNFPIARMDGTASGYVQGEFKNSHFTALSTNDGIVMQGTGVTNVFYGGVIATATGANFSINSTNTANDVVVFGTLYGFGTNTSQTTIRQGTYTQSAYAK